jgi:hypothetical protein
MWGTWVMLSIAGILALALLLGLVVLASPLFAIVIAALGGLALLAVASLRRSDEYVERDERPRVGRDAADVAAAPRPDRGAPAGGEGSGAAGGGRLPATPGGPTRST